jgi:hypothetical protein
MKWIFLVAATAAAGCGVKKVDPCAGVSGTCLAIQVLASPTVSGADALTVTLTGVGVDTQKRVGGGALPIAIGVLFDSLPSSPLELRVTVDASHAGRASTGSVATTIATGQHQAVDVQLVAGAAGADMAPGAGADMAPAASRCPAPNGAVCDGFESGSISDLWAPNQTGGVFTVDDTRSYRGTRSLHIHTNAVMMGNSTQMVLNEGSILQRSPSDLWMRAFYYLSSRPAAAITVLGVAQSVAPYDGDGINVHPDGTLHTFDGLGSYLDSTTTMPLGAWACLEWHVHLAHDATGYQQVFVDGVEARELSTPEPTNPTPPVGGEAVGVSVFMATTAVDPFDVWIDEIAIDAARIGCDQ